MSIIFALAAIPGLLGTQEAIRQAQQKERREEHRARRCNLIARCIKSSIWSREINGRPLVLRDGGVYIGTGKLDDTLASHQLAGYFLPYPDSDYEGLVTTITDVAPIMNWVYINSATHQVCYGIRKDAQPNLNGPFDCTRQDRRLTFQGWEGFVAVEVATGLWSVFFDLDDDGMRGKMRQGIIAEGTRVLEIELCRVEKRWKKDANVRNADQTINREKELDPEGKEVIHQNESNEPLQPGDRLSNGDTAPNSASTRAFESINNVSANGGHPLPTTAPSTVQEASTAPSINIPSRRSSLRASRSTKSNAEPPQPVQQIECPLNNGQDQNGDLSVRPGSAGRKTLSLPSNSEPNHIPSPGRTSGEGTLQSHRSGIPSQTVSNQTTIRVEPPVVLSTHRLRPKGHNQPPQAPTPSMQMRNERESGGSRNGMNEYDTMIDFSSSLPLALRRVGTFEEHNTGKDHAGSGQKKLLRRLGKGHIRTFRGDDDDLLNKNEENSEDRHRVTKVKRILSWPKRNFEDANRRERTRRRTHEYTRPKKTSEEYATDGPRDSHHNSCSSTSSGK